jgi:hypothetical protein
MSDEGDDVRLFLKFVSGMTENPSCRNSTDLSEVNAANSTLGGVWN